MPRSGKTTQKNASTTPISATSDPSKRRAAARNNSSTARPPVTQVAQCFPSAAQAYYADVKGRMAKFGREPDDLKIMPAFCPVLGRTRADAQAKFDEFQELVDPLAGLASLYAAFGDLSGYPLDGPVPDDAIGTLGMRSGSAQLRERMRQENYTIRELYLRTGVTGSARIGTPSDIADAMQEWFEERHLPTASTLHQRICRAAARTSWSWSCPSCGGAGCSVPNMRARRCEKISGSNVRQAATLPRAWIGSWTPPNKPAGKRRPTPRTLRCAVGAVGGQLSDPIDGVPRCVP